MDFVSGDDNTQSRNTEPVRSSWSPYYLPPLTDYIQSGSTPEDKVWKREDDYDQLPSNYNPDYTKMYMMMQAMKKMDSGSSKPGVLTRILDNPTTLVMATFIPISLIIAASLPLIMNVMMNGITIPALIPSPNGARTRGFISGNTTDILGSVLESFVDFSARYVDSPDCLQRIICNMAVKNDENAVPGSKYLKRATKIASLIVNDDILNTFGVKNLVHSIKKGTCDEVKCGKNDKNFSKFLELVKQEVHNYSYKTLPKLG
nr:uncharacterized protein LOC110282264 isoform X2 [Parasteatoda tepidariorum]